MYMYSLNYLGIQQSYDTYKQVNRQYCSRCQIKWKIIQTAKQINVEDAETA